MNKSSSSSINVIQSGVEITYNRWLDLYNSIEQIMLTGSFEVFTIRHLCHD